MNRRSFRLLLAFTALTTGLCHAQFQFWPDSTSVRLGSGHFIRTEGGAVVDEDTVRTARETLSNSTTTPTWTNTPGFEKSVFPSPASSFNPISRLVRAGDLVVAWDGGWITLMRI